MRFSFAAAVLAGSTLAAAVPLDGSSLFKRGSAIESPNGTCGIVGAGAGNGYVCPKGTTKCCSKYGYCGNSEEHCGSGCQDGFGSCTPGKPIPDHKPRRCKPKGPKPPKPTNGGSPTGAPSTAPTGSGKPSAGGPKPTPTGSDKPSAGGPKPTPTGSDKPSTGGPKPTPTGSDEPSSGVVTPTSSVTPSATGGEEINPSITASSVSVVPSASASALPAIPYGTWINECVVEDTIALTFDDGPYTYTEKLLNILQDAGAKATFFVNGKNWGEDIAEDSEMQALLHRMLNEGHQIGSHTYTHEDLNAVDDTTIRSTMSKLDDVLRQIIGKAPTYMRPPYFNCDDGCLAIMKDLQYRVIHANLDTKDYENNKPETNANAQSTFNSAIDASSPGESQLVLMHDVHTTTVDLLVPAIIEKINQVNANGRKLRFVTVGECLGQSPDTWYKA